MARELAPAGLRSDPKTRRRGASVKSHPLLYDCCAAEREQAPSPQNGAGRRPALAQNFLENPLGPPRPTPLVSPGLRHRCVGPAAPERSAFLLANHRSTDLVPPLGHPDATPAGQYPDAGARRRYRGDAVGCEPGLAHQPLRIPRPALAGLGIDAALCDTCLCVGVRLCRPVGLRRSRANLATGRRRFL